MPEPTNEEILLDLIQTALNAPAGADGRMSPQSQAMLAKVAGLESDYAERLAVPLEQNSGGFRCGPAALLSVAEFFGAYKGSVEELADLMGTTEEDGTPPPAMLEFAGKIGLDVEGVQGMTRMRLERELIMGHPVIVCMQAWGEERYYADDESGHWVNVTGLDNANFYFEDSELEEGQYGWMPKIEFMQRWHDRDGQQNPYYHFGIIVRGRRGEK